MEENPQQQQARQRHRESHTSLRSKDENQNSVTAIQIETNSISISDDDENDKSSLYSKNKNKVSGTFTLISVTVLISLVLLFVKYMDNRLPTPLMEKDLLENPKSFIEERARRDLHTLSTIGIRVTGSYATDVTAVERFMEILEKIKANQSSLYNIEFEEQRPSGSFWLDDDEGSTSSYSKIANVVAKLEPADVRKRTNNSILYNCHFDSKPGSPGATDNVISCSVMLEVLRVLSCQNDLVIQNTLVFLFNGAEELGLQGAHGFVQGKTSHLDLEKGHPWSKNLKAFINLEGAGAGGREILFQATGASTGQTGWLLKAYKEGPYPFGTVLAEEAFQFGLIPSDTDFRIFRDFSQTPGLDIAYIKNGWVYHTKWDKLSEIPPGSIQHMGANALAIAEHLGSMGFTVPHDSAGEMVFFDVLGAFMISYSKTVGIVINILVGVGTIVVIIWDVGWKVKTLLTYVKFLGSTILAWGLAIGAAALVAVILNGAGYPKPFYSYPSLAAVLFGIPAMLTQILVYSFCLRSSPRETWLAGKFTLALILLITTFITRAAYIFVAPLIFGVFGWFAARYLMRGWPRAIMVTYVILSEIIPLMMSTYLTITLSDVFVPILGRSGSETNGNLFFGIIIAAMLSVIVLPGLVPLFVNYDKKVLLTCLLTSIFILNPMIVFGFLGKVPYQEKTPMRLTIADVDRIWYDSKGTEVRSESGYWFWVLDSNTKDFMPQFVKTVAEVENIEDEILDYENCEYLYCTQPFIWPTTKDIKKTHWVPKPNSHPASLRNTVSMKILENTIIGTPDRRRILLEFHGPTQMPIVLSPQKNWDAKINFQILGQNEPIDQEGSTSWKGRKVYFIYHGRGYEYEPLKISMELTRTGDPAIGQDDSLLDIQQSALFLHSDEVMNANFTDFLNRFPSWAYTGYSWSTVMKMYKIV